MTKTEHRHERLEPQQERKAEEEQSLDAKTTLEVVRREGERELERAPSALAWSGLAGGLAMGLSMATEGVLHAALPDATWRPLIAKVGYAVGFLVVTLGSQHLYTENTLTPVIPYLAERSRSTLWRMLRLWWIVLLTNVIGAALFAFAAARLDVFAPEVRHSLSAIATEALAPEPASLFVRGIFAGWLVALMVWMLPAAKSAQIWVIIILAWLIGAAGLSHIIVGTVEGLYLVWEGQRPIVEFFIRYWVPTLLGNTIGGVALVAALNHKQATAGA